MSNRYTQAKRTLTALRQVRKPVPAPSRVKESKKRYNRVRERRKLTAEMDAS